MKLLAQLPKVGSLRPHKPLTIKKALNQKLVKFMKQGLLSTKLKPITGAAAKPNFPKVKFPKLKKGA